MTEQQTRPPRNEAAGRLLAELQENPLPGARYAFTVVRDRLPAALREQTRITPIDEDVLAQALYSGAVQHVIHAYSYTNREIAREIIAAYLAALPRTPGEDR